MSADARRTFPVSQSGFKRTLDKAHQLPVLRIGMPALGSELRFGWSRKHNAILFRVRAKNVCQTFFAQTKRAVVANVLGMVARVAPDVKSQLICGSSLAEMVMRGAAARNFATASRKI
jgi:hypothetical protein